MVESHPSRVRGLKKYPCKGYPYHSTVAPFAGAWIEIRELGNDRTISGRRTLRGCVD